MSNKKDLIILLWEECKKSNINTESFEDLMTKWSGEKWWDEKDQVEAWEGFICNIDLIKYDVDPQEIVGNEDLLNVLLKYAGYGLSSPDLKNDDLKKAKDEFVQGAGSELDKEIKFKPENPTLQKFLLGDCSKVLIGSAAGAEMHGRLKYDIGKGDGSTCDKRRFNIEKDKLINEISLYQSIIKSKSLEDVVISEDDEPCKSILEGKDKLPHFIAKILSLVVFERGWDLISTTDCIGLFKLLFDRLDHEDKIEDFLNQYINIPYIDDNNKTKLVEWFEIYKKSTEDKDRDKELKNNLLKCIYFGTKMLRYCLDEDYVNNTELEKSDKLENFKLLKRMEKLVYPIISDRNTFNKIETDAPIIYTGAPGTGKTYGIENYVKGRCIAKPMKKTDNLPDDFLQYKIVQFHSSYDYTDFVEGIRPIPDPKGDNKTIFVRVDGIFKEFCRNVELYNRNGKAKDDRDEDRVEQDKFYFIIDEINRADLGKVFGELMYCFEKDKRGPKHSVTTQYSNLITYEPKECSKYVKIKKDEDVFAEGFFIPENVIIIGSMNDIDRSVETFDFALRRRFTWITLDTNKMVEQVLGDLGINEDEQNYVKNMNKVIYGEIGANLGLNKTYCIGPAHFKKLANVTKDGYEKEKNAIWENTVCQVLREYTRGRAAEDVNELLLACYKAFMGDDSINELPGEEEVDYCKIIKQVANDEDTSKQIVFTGAPGTGKTYGIEHAVEDLAKEQAANDDEQAKKYYKFVQFHSSYDYTDFIEGLRPIDGDKEGPVFVKMEGEFKKFCRQAAEDDKNKYYFIIDEINRADLGKVFGELMYCFEYRGKDNAIQIQYSNLVTYEEKEGKYSPIEGNDVFEKGFYIPNNVVIIGSMNDIDRSVETFDFALRRRFKWVEVKANEKNYEKVFKGIKQKTLSDDDRSKIDRIVKMNSIISGTGPDEGAQFGLNDSYWIGPSFFKEYIEINKSLDVIWENRIEPTIREYVRGRNSNSVENFILKCKVALIPKKEAL